MMRLFDIVLFDAGEGLAKKLGFYNLVRIGTRFPSSSLLTASSEHELFKSANNPSVKCIVIDKNMVNGVVAGKLADIKKPMLINANSVVTEDRGETMRNIGSLKRSISRTKFKSTDIGLASLAKDANELFSCAQLVEIAKLIGIDENAERRALSAIGAAYAEKE
ncbi:MAG: hypothetical protein KGH69_02360 [Candidatus Micrarchaeota archaeon]|nr:hypothetical protein [Candidatus Micrarchaeota archaeon]